jgi:DNA primase catalytic core
MAFISQNTIDKAKEADMVSVISHYTKLRRSGASWKGKSPFQDERTPSFVVTPSKPVWKCFSSMEGGDSAIGFVMKMERCSYFEAIEKVCNMEKIHIEYDQPQNGVDKELWQKKQIRRKTSKEMLEYANIYFQQSLKQSDEAKNYLSGRKLSIDTLITFGIGYAPNAAHFVTKDLALCEEISLLSSLDNGNQYKDFFLDRIMIPFLDRGGNTIGFAGRELHSKQNGNGIKYKNSRNNEYYDKDKYLYGLYTAGRLLKNNDWLYVCEGYFNVMRLYEYGLAAVATGSASISDNHIAEIKKITTKVVLFRDNDKAGKDATDREIEVFLANGFQVRVVLFPEKIQHKAPNDSFFWFKDAACKAKSDIDDIGKEVYTKYENKAINFIAEKNFQFIDNKIPDWCAHYSKELVVKHLGYHTVNWLVWAVNRRWNASEIPADAQTEDRANFMAKIARYVAIIPSPSSRNQWTDEAGQIFKKKAFNLAIKEALEELKEEGNEKQYADVTVDENGIHVMGTHIANFCMEVTARTDITLARKNGKRRFGWEVELWNPGKDRLYLTIPEEDLATSQAFYKFVMSFGFNYSNTNENHHRYLIQYFNQELPMIASVHNAGWNENAQMYFYSNAAFSLRDYQILQPNEKSIIMDQNNTGYKLSLLSDSKLGTVYSDFEQFQYKQSKYDIFTVAQIIQRAWGDEALLTTCYTMACCFFDFTMKVHGNFFPIFWLWSTQASSGKTKLATLNTQFFGEGRTHDLLNDNTSIPGIVAALEGIQNTVHVLDDFKRGANYHKQIKMLQGFAQGNGHTIFDVETQRNITKTVRGGIFTTSNEIPTESIYNAFRTRLFVLELTQNSDRTKEQYAAYEEVVKLLESNLSQVSVGILKHRKVVTENYVKVHQELKKYFREQVKQQYDGVEDRYYESATFIAGTIIILLRNRLISFPLNEQEIKEMCVDKIIEQIGLERNMEPLQEFWSILQLAWEDKNQKVVFKIDAEQIANEETGEMLWEGIALKFRFERLYRLYKDSFKAMGTDINRMLSEFEMRRRLEDAEYFVAKSIATRMAKDADEIAEAKKKAPKKKIEPQGNFRTMCIDYEIVAKKFGLELIDANQLSSLKSKITPKS